MVCSKYWETLIQNLNQEVFTIFTVDLPGFGDSTYHKSIESVDEMAQYLR